MFFPFQISLFEDGIPLINAATLCPYISKIFKSAFKNESFDLILSGLQSDDIGNGQLGVLIAEHLEMSHGSLVMETETSDNTTTSDSDKLRANVAAGSV